MALKIERGNPGHQKLNREMPELPPASDEAPAILLEDPEALAYWQAHAPNLVIAGHASEEDMDALRIYCEQMARRDRLVRTLRTLEEMRVAAKGQPEQVLAIADAIGRRTTEIDKAELRIRQSQETLGITPTSRNNVHAVKRAANPSGQSAKQRFLARRGA